jgi:hypothetical protein
VIIKKKSLLVALLSSIIICGVLILTLVGYLFYLELKDNELKNVYQSLLSKVNSKLYSRHIEISDLDAAVDDDGALDGKPVIKGTIKNNGYRDIVDMLVLIRFLDKDGAVLYEVVFHPQEPSLGFSSMAQTALPYITTPPKTRVKTGDSFPFKNILAHCPKEIFSQLKNKKEPSGESPKRPGKLYAEILSVSF